MGFPKSEKLMLRIGGSEDVSYMVNRVREQGGKAAFMRAMTITTGPAHNRRYDFDECLLVPTVQAFCAAVADLMK